MLKAINILKKLLIDVEKDINATDDGLEVFGYIETNLKDAIKELKESKKDLQTLKLLFDSEFCRCSNCGQYKRNGFDCCCEND